MISIKVDYEVSEYRHILKELFPIISANRKTGEWPDKKLKADFWMKAMIRSFGSVIIFFKLRKVGSCLFEIS